ncbi:pyruvate kinase [Bacteroides reticulotermitis JCM 10512]|uniref:Pyruvate kinase n=2 Tax=Bacteroides reticulotermitis TaxID=1133319 RepID=W4US99_9BACE|nr:pyruvate kinase [Bacteroides reticulotermitis JCM 10512]
MNTAHASRDGFEALIANVRTVSNRIGILMDTKGPEVRTTASAEPILYLIGDKVKIVGNPDLETTRECIAVSYPEFVHDLAIGGTVLIDDGELELEVVDKNSSELICEVKNEATLGSRKSVNVPGVRINLPSLTEKDKNNILYAIEKDIDFIAHSFVRNRQDVLDIRAILDAHDSDIKIIAKIENQEGVDNIDEILEVADGVMVARGDLGIEVPQERIPGIQRVLIRKCILAKKPVIVATQMLHTMINNPRPTRAEVTDIANAIYYRTDALMLSGETAYGKYPLEAVKTMAKIAAQAEQDKLEENDIRIPLDDSNDVTAFLAKQAVKATAKLKIRAIITDSYSGRTARNLAAFRGKYPVLAICYKEKTMRHLALSYGVEAIYMPELANGQDYYFAALRRLLKEGRLQPSDMVGYLSSGKAGTQTSFLEINDVEDALKYSEETVLPNKNRYL